MMGKLDDEIIEQRRDAITSASGTPDDFEPVNDKHLAAMIGAGEINISVGNLTGCIKRWSEMDKFLKAWEVKYPSRVSVRIKSSWLFDIRDRQMLTYRQFTVLCGVYSVIGDKPFAKVTRWQIQRRALGYKDQEVFERELPNRTDEAEPLTLAQINYTLDQLDERGFFARFRPNKRETFYSIRHKTVEQKAELAKLIIGCKTRSAQVRAQRGTANEALQQ